MCYDDQARPPAPPGTHSPAKGEDIVLTARDGNRFAAYAAFPEKPGEAQVIIYPDVRGLHQFYKELALRFAEVGIPAIAIDYFGRTAGLTDRSDGFDFKPHVAEIKLDTFSLDVRAAQDYLRQKTGPDTPTFIMGFCMGGTLTVMTGTDAQFGFAGVIPFYAGMSRNYPGKGTVLDVGEQVKYPVLGLFGGADQGIPEADVKKFDEKLDAANVEHKIVIYPGAPHSFFDRRATEFADASTDAWQRVLDFIGAKKREKAT